MEPRFFATPAHWRNWLEQHHALERELLVGFYTRSSGKPSITWPESVDDALCFGWIDGVRHKIDDVSYSIRFSPRRPGSVWSVINTRRAAELISQGLMHPAGLKAFEARREDRSGIYSSEQKDIDFSTAQKKQFQANKAAWKFFSAKPPWYRRASTWWVISAKRPETREKRLAVLIKDSEHGRTIPALTRPSKTK